MSDPRNYNHDWRNQPHQPPVPRLPAISPGSTSVSGSGRHPPHLNQLLQPMSFPTTYAPYGYSTNLYPGLGPSTNTPMSNHQEPIVSAYAFPMPLQPEPTAMAAPYGLLTRTDDGINIHSYPSFDSAPPGKLSSLRFDLRLISSRYPPNPNHGDHSRQGYPLPTSPALRLTRVGGPPQQPQNYRQHLQPSQLGNPADLLQPQGAVFGHPIYNSSFVASDFSLNASQQGLDNWLGTSPMFQPSGRVIFDPETVEANAQLAEHFQKPIPGSLVSTNLEQRDLAEEYADSAPQQVEANSFHSTSLMSTQASAPVPASVALSQVEGQPQPTSKRRRDDTAQKSVKKPKVAELSEGALALAYVFMANTCLLRGACVKLITAEPSQGSGPFKTWASDAYNYAGSSFNECVPKVSPNKFAQLKQSVLKKCRLILDLAEEAAEDAFGLNDVRELAECLGIPHVDAQQFACELLTLRPSDIAGMITKFNADYPGKELPERFRIRPFAFADGLPAMQGHVIRYLSPACLRLQTKFMLEETPPSEGIARAYFDIYNPFSYGVRALIPSYSLSCTAMEKAIKAYGSKILSKAPDTALEFLPEDQKTVDFFEGALHLALMTLPDGKVVDDIIKNHWFKALEEHKLGPFAPSIQQVPSHAEVEGDEGGGPSAAQD
ncbi:hypothetical protein CVT26_005105 [Gymnopilus dilepis]|uniref:Uncharacterized protein n=1 Tax=Gymnopilus dilepis TaxID=231916 RepID=A0A409Y089_9AGAR|nr:hypothetical protein CVT26_005105 [Gymnopilus dilepis]